MSICQPCRPMPSSDAMTVYGPRAGRLVSRVNRAGVAAARSASGKYGVSSLLRARHRSSLAVLTRNAELG
jgi:hypothetical protein